MNVAVVNVKDLLKYFLKLVLAIFSIFVMLRVLATFGSSMKDIVGTADNSKFLNWCLDISMPFLNTEGRYEKHRVKITDLINVETVILGQAPIVINQPLQEIENENIQNVPEPENNTTVSPGIQISKTADTQAVTDRNYKPRSNTYYGTVNIDNQTNYELTQEMLTPDVEIANKKDVLIYHTHTCESYTPCENYNYTMTGNYRTTDSNFNVVRVGRELTTHLQSKGFNVVHDETYCDYPSYSGSYSRSLEVATKQLEEKPAGIVIDLHRDAVGNGDTYGPTVMVNNQRVAQLMLVIGTDGGGSEHPNWVQNLKTAVKIQEKANEMYPGLFRSIIVRNSRYNQHIANGASIIEVGATANTLGECLLSMQCLANVLEEVCK